MIGARRTSEGDLTCTEGIKKEEGKVLSGWREGEGRRADVELERKRAEFKTDLSTRF